VLRKAPYVSAAFILVVLCLILAAFRFSFKMERGELMMKSKQHSKEGALEADKT